jgi:Mn-dependent DtxR family transcriptional regulator
MSESIEMYLESIYVIRNRQGYVRNIDIAHEMNFSKPTITQQIKRLKAKGLVITDKEGMVQLTNVGEHIAMMIYERHQELSRVLRFLGVDEKIAAEDACRIEHYISPETFDAIKAYFDPIIGQDKSTD